MFNIKNGKITIHLNFISNIFKFIPNLILTVFSILKLVFSQAAGSSKVFLLVGCFLVFFKWGYYTAEQDLAARNFGNNGNDENIEFQNTSDSAFFENESPDFNNFENPEVVLPQHETPPNSGSADLVQSQLKLIHNSDATTTHDSIQATASVVVQKPIVPTRPTTTTTKYAAQLRPSATRSFGELREKVHEKVEKFEEKVEKLEFFGQVENVKISDNQEINRNREITQEFHAPPQKVQTPPKWMILGFTDENFIPVSRLWYQTLTELGYNEHYLVTLDDKSSESLCDTHRCIDYPELYKNFHHLSLKSETSHIDADFLWADRWTLALHYSAFFGIFWPFQIVLSYFLFIFFQTH